MAYQYEVGKTYLTQRGEAVRVVLRHAELRGYETVMGDDGAHRYDRSHDSLDAGRCTGTEHDYSCPDNFARPTQEVAWVPVSVPARTPDSGEVGNGDGGLRGEATVHVRSRLYEFAKRRDRAAAAGVSPSDQQVQPTKEAPNE